LACHVRRLTARLRHVAEFAQHFHHSPDQLGADDIRRYQLFLIQEKKLAWSTYNQIVCALRFFCAKTSRERCWFCAGLLERDWWQR